MALLFRQTLPEFDFGELMLSTEAQVELDEAVAVDMAAQVRNEGAPARGGSSSSLKRPASPPLRDEPVDSAPTAAARFYASVGIQDLAPVQRAGVRCLHCSDVVQKGDLRFVVCQKVNKPGRSIHTGCLFQLQASMIAPSLQFLRRKLEMTLSSSERRICDEAVSTLSSLQGP